MVNGTVPIDDGMNFGGNEVKVGFTTKNFKNVDAHFGWAPYIVIYDVSPDSYSVDRTFEFGDNLKEDGNEDKLLPKIEAVSDCAVLYVSAIGGSAAARVVARKVHPIKVPEESEILDLIERFQAILRGTPPPWLRKVLMKDESRNLEQEMEG